MNAAGASSGERSGNATTVDSHAHLDMAAFDDDRDAVIRRAWEAGVTAILTIATVSPGNASLDRTLDIVGKYPCVYAGVGIHPHDARLADSRSLDLVADASAHPKVVLWGEIGLDYHYRHSPEETQRLVFTEQLRLASQHRLPVAIHCRDAWEDLISILRNEYPVGDSAGILHSFTGSPEQALEAVSLGFMVSFSGIVTFKNAGLIREAALAVPLGSILVETDCPYLAPVPHRGKRNEPAFVIDVTRSLAHLRGLSFAIMASVCSENFSRLLGAGRDILQAPLGTDGGGDRLQEDADPR